MSKLVPLFGAAAILVSLAQPVLADESNPVIVHRQGIYKIASGHMNGLKSALVLKDGPVANVTYHAEGIVAAFQRFGDAYPVGSDKGETKARPEIWTDNAKYQQRGKDAYAAAVAMVEAAKSGDQAKSVDAFKALGGKCKACHEDFKKD